MTEQTEAATTAKTASISLRAGDAVMRLLAIRRATGAAVTMVTTTDAAKKSVRGMTQQHPTMDAARAALDDLATQAEKLGWTRRPRVAREAKPDAFATLPTAPTTPTAAPKSDRKNTRKS